MKRSALAVVSLVAGVSLLASASCSSWDTGSASIDDVEHACVEMVQTFARADERCGGDYHTAYDARLRAFAKGDCKNVTSIRDEDALRTRCLPWVNSAECSVLIEGTVDEGKVDPSCKQLRLSQ